LIRLRSDYEEASLTHFTLARDALALLCGLQGAATLAIDLNRTHATNPLWTGHARFHVVWQTCNTALLAALELGLLFLHGPYLVLRFYLAAALAAVPMVGFLLALASRKLYRGSLWDPNGIPPAQIALFDRRWSIDLNTVVVVAGLIYLAALLELSR
jgi:hypothetical protein